MDFLTESFEELQKIQKEFNVFKIESDEPVERIKAFVDGQLLGLDIISTFVQLLHPQLPTTIVFLIIKILFF